MIGVDCEVGDIDGDGRHPVCDVHRNEIGHANPFGHRMREPSAHLMCRISGERQRSSRVATCTVCVMATRHRAPAQAGASAPHSSWDPLGVTPDGRGGANVALWAEGAESVDLCVFDDDGGERRIPITERVFNVRACFDRDQKRRRLEMEATEVTE